MLSSLGVYFVGSLTCTTVYNTTSCRLPSGGRGDDTAIRDPLSIHGRQNHPCKCQKQDATRCHKPSSKIRNHTLFESHLIYGITVWGGESKTKLEPLFNLQKKCLRILFGDKEAYYLDKFRTSVRTRPMAWDHKSLEQNSLLKKTPKTASPYSRPTKSLLSSMHTSTTQP